LVLDSLRKSNVPLDEEMLVFHIDGYLGSKFESQFEKNRTTEVENLVRKFFPRSHIIKQDKNIGIARSFYVVMDYIFNEFEHNFAIFQEEDTFLAPHYFQVMSSILQEVASLTWVGAISINDVDHYQILTNEFVMPTFGTREMAFSRQVFLDSRDIYGTYLEALGNSYRLKNHEDVRRALAKFGIDSLSPKQDSFQHELLRWHKKLHLRINIPGSFQANFSEGESIPGFSIFALVTEYLKNLRTSHGLLPQSARQFDYLDLNQNKLEFIEDKLWNGRKSVSRQSSKQIPMSPLGSKLIIIRNRLGLSRFKFFMETIIISNEMRNKTFSSK